MSAWKSRIEFGCGVSCLFAAIYSGGLWLYDAHSVTFATSIAFYALARTFFMQAAE